jgi:ribosomal protein S6 kinase beta
MVSSEVSALTKAFASKTTVREIILPMGPSDVVGTENLEFDFADVFGTTPVQSLTSPTAADLTEEVYDDPVVIFKRSHSLVGPTALVSTHSPRFSFLNFHETKNSLDLLESLSEEGAREQGKSETCEKSEEVGLDDFEILKLVGQGAFGKVFQVKKKGSNEIYAMKVMRKDKILEKNHVEYMKAERDILTKVDHPFIVQLRYSFQVLSLFRITSYMLLLYCIV